MADIYGLIPDVDSRGISGQIGKFRRWNPNPIGNEAANLGKINPELARVIAQARADNPNLRFVLGSGARTAEQQDLAKAWGWSPTGAKGGGDAAIHMRGNAADLWPLNDQGQVNFDPGAQKAVSDAIKAAAAKLNVNLTAGGDWKHPDQPHFEMTGNPTWTPAPNQPTRPGQTTAPATTTTASTPFSLSAPGGSIPSAGQFQPLIDAAAKKYGIDPNFLSRLLWQENRFRPQGTSSAGAQGFAQFIPSTAARYGVDVNDPASSIEGAAHYLSDLSGRYGGNMGLMAAGYNWGEGNVDKWLQGKSKPPSETLNYVNTITGHAIDEWKADPRLPLGPFTGPGRSPSGPPSAPTPPGTTINTAGAGASSGVLPGFGTKEQSDAFRKNLGDFDKALGGRGLDDGQGDQQRQLKPPEMVPSPGLRNYPGIAGVEAQARQLSPQVTGYSPGLYGHSLDSQPLAWSNAPISAPAWLRNAGLQQPQGQPPGMGTSLNSMDPQMLAMLYGTGGGGSFGGSDYG